jgi:hypothetical protein
MAFTFTVLYVVVHFLSFGFRDQFNIRESRQARPPFTVRNSIIARSFGCGCGSVRCNCIYFGGGGGLGIFLLRSAFSRLFLSAFSVGSFSRLFSLVSSLQRHFLLVTFDENA